MKNGVNLMEKYRIHPTYNGKSVRMSYQRQREVLEMPNLIEVQKNSYQWFLEKGLQEVFDDISPIEDYSGHLSLSFVSFTAPKEEEAKYSIEKCKERDATFAAPLKVKVRLFDKENKKEVKDQEIFMGDLPLMTRTGTFVINGAERVIVSQLVRSPGIYYGIEKDKFGKKLFSCTVIPNRGAWLEYETDANDIFYVRVDRTRKVPVTVLIRALGIGTDEEIIELFGDEPKLRGSLSKDVSHDFESGLLELYKKIRPGEPLSVESADSLINSMFFDARRYDLARVGRYKFNKKLHMRSRIVGHTLAEDVVDEASGVLIGAAGETVTREMADEIQNSAIPSVTIRTEEREVKVLSNLMVDLTHYEEEGLFLEGTGSMVLDRVNKIVYACESPRTNKTVLEDFCKQLGYTPVLFKAAGDDGTEIYHTNVMMHVGTEVAVVCLESIRDEAQRAEVKESLESTGKTIVEITFDQMNHFAGNMLELHNKDGQPCLIMSLAAYHSLTKAQVEFLESKMTLITPDLECIEQNGGGSARCMIAEIF